MDDDENDQVFLDSLLYFTFPIRHVMCSRLSCLSVAWVLMQKLKSDILSDEAMVDMEIV